MQVTIDHEVLKELQYILHLGNNAEKGAPVQFRTVQELTDYILQSVADGSRRPGSWERSMLESMGLISECPQHHVYRKKYGKEESH